jgi:hypothetical protein
MILDCAGCGRPWDRDDMLEAWFPRYSSEIVPGVRIAPLTLGWVGPCCAVLANAWQPGDPEPAP